MGKISYVLHTTKHEDLFWAHVDYVPYKRQDIKIGSQYSVIIDARKQCFGKRRSIHKVIGMARKIRGLDSGNGGKG